MSTIFNPSGSADGELQYRDAASWATARDASSSTEAPAQGANICCYVENSGGLYYIIRSFFTFATGTTLAGATITAATFSLYGGASGSDPTTDSAVLTASTQTDPTSLAQADYDNITKNSPTELADRFAYSSWASGAYNDFTLNASGLAAINQTPGGYTKFCLRAGKEVDDVAPSSTSSYIRCQFSDQTNKPKLTVTYTTPGGVKFFTFI